MLAALDGSCHTPVAALAQAEGDALRLRGLLLTPDGEDEWRTERTGTIALAAALGEEVGRELRALGGSDYESRLR